MDNDYKVERITPQYSVVDRMRKVDEHKREEDRKKRKKKDKEEDKRGGQSQAADVSREGQKQRAADGRGASSGEKEKDDTDHPGKIIDVVV